MGAPWNVTDVAISADGRFTADFGTRSVPAASLSRSSSDPLLTVNEFVLTGVTTSTRRFLRRPSAAMPRCSGRSRRTESASRGRRSARVRITGDALPTPVTTCP